MGSDSFVRVRVAIQQCHAHGFGRAIRALFRSFRDPLRFQIQIFALSPADLPFLKLQHPYYAHQIRQPPVAPYREVGMRQRIVTVPPVVGDFGKIRRSPLNGNS